jgi:hypothetical protein
MCQMRALVEPHRPLITVSPAHSTSRVHLGPASVAENPPSAAVQVLTTIGVLITHDSCFDHSTLLIDHVPAVGASALTSSPPLDRMQGNLTAEKQ